MGTLADFDHLTAAARQYGIEVAMDLAYQCSPDHPYVREHPEWFEHRPDGSVQYAENPPKKYEDIYPFDFETEAWRGVVAGIEGHCPVLDRPRRADFPRRQPAYETVSILAVAHRGNQAQCPDVIFLAEAFTRPKVMYRPGEAGFQPIVHLFHLAKHERAN